MLLLFFFFLIPRGSILRKFGISLSFIRNVHEFQGHTSLAFMRKKRTGEGLKFETLVLMGWTGQKTD